MHPRVARAGLVTPWRWLPKAMGPRASGAANGLPCSAYCLLSALHYGSERLVWCLTVAACAGQGARWQAMPWRWHPKMARAKDAQITPALWRKTSQWIALERELAAAVAGDTAVANMFRQSCLEVDWDDELER